MGQAERYGDPARAADERLVVGVGLTLIDREVAAPARDGVVAGAEVVDGRVLCGLREVDVIVARSALEVQVLDVDQGDGISIIVEGHGIRAGHGSVPSV